MSRIFQSVQVMQFVDFRRFVSRRHPRILCPWSSATFHIDNSKFRNRYTDTINPPTDQHNKIPSDQNNQYRSNQHTSHSWCFIISHPLYTKQSAALCGKPTNIRVMHALAQHILPNIYLSSNMTKRGQENAADALSSLLALQRLYITIFRKTQCAHSICLRIAAHRCLTDRPIYTSWTGINPSPLCASDTKASRPR